MTGSDIPNQHQKEVISETIASLDNSTDTQQLSQKLLGNTQLSNNDPERYIVKMFHDTSNGRLKDYGNASDKALRKEIINQLTERFGTNDNPEPFSSIDLDNITPGRHVSNHLRRSSITGRVSNFLG